MRGATVGIPFIKASGPLLPLAVSGASISDAAVSRGIGGVAAFWGRGNSWGSIGDTPKVAFYHYGKEWGHHYQDPLWRAPTRQPRPITE